MATGSVLTSAFPSLDPDIFNYIEGFLDSSKDEFQSPEEVYEAIGEMLHDVAGDDKNEAIIMEICTKLLHALRSDDKNDTGQLREQKTLTAPVYLGDMANNTCDDSEDVNSIWLKQRDYNTVVDQKKLEKAEAKLKQKQEKREGLDKVPTNVIIANEASASQAINKKDVKMENKGSCRLKDIRIENFDVAFGNKTLLQGADLTLAFGRRYGLVGRNGIGKSTLLRMLSSGHLKIPSHISVLHVEQEVIGDDTLALESVLECDELRHSLLKEEKALTAAIAIAKSGQDDPTLGQRLSQVYAELQAIDADSAPARASVILAGLGFSPVMQRRATREFSGGWRMRIALARALFSKPDLLLLDEPTNMLDMKAIIWLENYLQNWATTLLVVSHDRMFLESVPTDTLHFHSQRIEHYRGNYESFIKTMTEKLKNQQREFEAQQQFRAHVQEFIDRFRYNANRASLVQSKIKMLDKLPELQSVEKESSVVLRLPDPEALSPPVLQLDEVTFSYVEGCPILQDINLSINMESRICIVGDNGSGKTTLLKLLIGDLDPSKGIRHAHRNLVIGYFTQHHVDQLELGVSSLEFLAKKFPGKSIEEYRRQLGSFGISGDLALQSVASLSGGQKSRVAFATMCMTNPHFMVLDEPTNHLDVETVEALGLALNKYKGGVILVSHDEQLIQMICKELWLCKTGSVTSIEGGFAKYRKLVEAELAEVH